MISLSFDFDWRAPYSPVDTFDPRSSPQIRGFSSHKNQFK